MDAFGAYQMFMAMKFHFGKGTYDYFKYHGQTTAKRENFEIRKDKYQYTKLSKRKDLEFFLASNLVQKPNLWVGELFGPEGEDRYKDALKRKQSLTYQFKENMSTYDSLNNALVPKGGEYPLILKDFKQDTISMETMIILNECLDIFKYWNESLNDQILWPETRLKLEKYRGFLTINCKDFNKIMLDMFN